MPIRVKCPSCGKTLSAPREFAGRAVKCSECQSQLKIPLIVNTSPQPSETPQHREAGGWIASAALLLAGVALGILGGLVFATANSDTDKIIALEESLDNEEKRANVLESKLAVAVSASKKYEEELSNLEVLPVGEKPSIREQLLETRLVTARERASKLQRSLEIMRETRSSTTSSLGVSREHILSAIREIYTIKVENDDEDSFMGTLGVDTVLIISGPRGDATSVDVWGALTSNNLTDLARTLGIVTREVFEDDDWLGTWVDPAIQKVDVDYTISGTNEGFTLELSGMMLKESPIAMFTLKK